MVESIESDFVPLLVRNNKPGKEAELVEKYGEPAWNFPVTRFFDGDGEELLERKDRTWKLAELVPRMKAALEKAGKTSEILPLLEAELVPTKLVAFSQSCFWTGELVLGGIDGVIRTEAGWLGGREVTLVYYDSRSTTPEKIEKAAKARSCADRMFQGAELKGFRVAKDSDQKRQIAGTPFEMLKNLTPYQRTKVNAFARTEPAKAKRFLTPRQRKLVEN